MAQLRLTGPGPQRVHDVLGLLRDKTVHDVLDPDTYSQAAGQRLFTLAGGKPGFITGFNAGGVHLRVSGGSR